MYGETITEPEIPLSWYFETVRICPLRDFMTDEHFRKTWESIPAEFLGFGMQYFLTMSLRPP